MDIKYVERPKLAATRLVGRVQMYPKEERSLFLKFYPLDILPLHD